MKLRYSFLLCYAPLALVVWLAPGRCLAQDSRSAAEALFRQGRDLMDRRQLDEARRKFADTGLTVVGNRLAAE